MFVFQAPNGKQLLSRICETGNNCFKVDYIPVVAGVFVQHYTLLNALLWQKDNAV